MPDRLPIPFCRLVQRPAARGPARVCVIAQWLDVKVPNAMHANMRSAIDAVESRTATTGRMVVEPSSPATTIVLRTRVGVPPAAIQRSEIQPAQSVAPAIAKNAID